MTSLDRRWRGDADGQITGGKLWEHIEQKRPEASRVLSVCLRFNLSL